MYIRRRLRDRAPLLYLPAWMGSGVVGTFLIPLTPGECRKGNRDKSKGARPFYLHFRSAGWQGDPFLELKLLNSAQFISI